VEGSFAYLWLYHYEALAWSLCFLLKMNAHAMRRGSQCWCSKLNLLFSMLVPAAWIQNIQHWMLQLGWWWGV